MEQELISIVIPIYNAQIYLDTCIKSIINQTYKNLEIILVDDGSTDKSAMICEYYAKSDKRIKYIYQDNAGAIAARRTGVRGANGRYVGFVDSDDYIDLDLFEKINQMLNKYYKEGMLLDLLEFGFYMGKEREIESFGKIPFGLYLYEDMEYIHSNMIAYDNQIFYGIMPNMCNKIFRKDLLKEVIENVDTRIYLGEDADCVYRYLLQCNTILVSEICGYHYRMHEGSVMHSVNRKYLQNVDIIYNDLLEVFSKHENSDVLLMQLEIWISRLIHRAPNFLGFRKKCRQIEYFFPRIDLIAGKKIVLYGAGNVGKSYYTLFKKTNCCNVICWIDKKGTRVNENVVSSVECVKKLEYEYIILAVKKKGMAEEMTAQLEEMGIERKKILWEIPCE